MDCHTHTHILDNHFFHGQPFQRSTDILRHGMGWGGDGGGGGCETQREREIYLPRSNPLEELNQL